MKRDNDIRYEISLFMSANQYTKCLADIKVYTIEEWVVQDYPNPISHTELITNPELIKYRENWGFNAW